MHIVIIRVLGTGLLTFFGQVSMLKTVHRRIEGQMLEAFRELDNLSRRTTLSVYSSREEISDIKLHDFSHTCSKPNKTRGPMLEKAAELCLRHHRTLVRQSFRNQPRIQARTDSPYVHRPAIPLMDVTITVTALAAVS